MRSYRSFLLVVFILVSSRWAYADQNNLELSLQDIFDLKISVVSKREQKINEAPAITYIVTKQDIRESGARDFLDVLNMVPGFSIAVDLFGVPSIMARGLYGFEGRGLIMINGMQMNGKLHGTYPVGNDFPIHMIERIEIVRGPGSVMYGGAAELFVINIITKKLGPADQDGGHSIVNVRYGSFDNFDKVSIFDTAANYLYKKNDFNFSGLIFAGKGGRGADSDRYGILRGIYGQETYGVETENNRVTNLALALTADYKNLSVNGVIQRYKHRWPGMQVNGGVVQGYDKDIEFNTTNLSAAYKFNLSEQFTLTPTLYFHQDLEWANKVIIGVPGHSVEVDKASRMPITSWAMDLIGRLNVGNLNASFGAYGNIDRASADYEGLRRYRMDPAGPDEKHVSFWNTALFFDTSYTFFNNLHLNTGLRYDKHEMFGSQLSPRIGISSTHEQYHIKLLYSEAFRAPNIAGTAVNGFSLGAQQDSSMRFPIQNESTTVTEFEFGLRPMANLNIVTNFYQQQVNDIIQFDPAYSFKLKNGGKISVYGMESDLTSVFSRHKTRLNFAVPRLGANRNGRTYMAPLRVMEGQQMYRELPLATPKYKVFLNHSFKISDQFSIFGNSLIYGKQYNQRYDADFNALSEIIGPQVVYGLGADWTPNSVKSLNVRLSVNDLFNKRIRYVSSFDSYLDNTHQYSSVRYRGREVLLSVNYEN